jgi:anti-sigma factor RsiW
MQHLDEGTIHSWLDGALSVDEAARTEAHVAECPQCAAAVAEARGLIAASSRILTALDHVPRAVVPVARPVEWYNRASWRAAAAVLVVAVGSLVVVRNSEHGTVAVPAKSDNIRTADATVTQPQTTATSRGATATSKSGVASPVTAPSAPASRVASPSKPVAEADLSRQPIVAGSQPYVVRPEPMRDEARDAAIGGNAAAPSAVAGAVAATARPALSSRVPGATMLQAVVPEEPTLKVVGTPRVIGAKVTLYEVAPGDTVTFTEVLNVQLNSVATTGISSAEPQARRSMEKSAATVTVQAAPASPGVPPLQVDVVNGVTTISWPDVSTGNMLRLSGRMPVARLRDIKLRIERERATAAAKKKP